MVPPAKKRKPNRPWQEIAKEAQQHRDETISRVSPGLPVAFERIQFSEGLPLHSMHVPGKALHHKDFEITNKLPEQLLSLMASGSLTASDVTTAFLRRAVLAQKLVRKIYFNLCIVKVITLSRQTASRNSYRNELWREQNIWTIISANTGKQLDPSMDSRPASKK